MCRVRRPIVVAAVLALLLSTVPATATVGADGTGGGLSAGQFAGSDVEPDGVLMRVDLRADGSAHWTIEYRIRLNDQNTTEAFDSIQSDIQQNESAYTETFAGRMRQTANAAENTTGREMTVENVTVVAERRQLPQEYGVVTYEFDWTGFAAVSGGELRAGDALSGLFLDRQTTLVFAWPSEYSVVKTDPEPDEERDDAAVWTGPSDFGSGQPAVTLSTAAASTEDDGSGGSGDDGSGDRGASDEAGDTPWLLFAVGSLALLSLGIGAAVFWRRSRRETVDAVTTPPVTSADERTDRDSESDDAEPNMESDDGSVETAAADDGTEETETSAAGVDPWTDELLSNEERVLALLKHHDGRMKQQDIASELDWSAAKTSQVLGKMRDAESVETFRLGRENVVSLPGEGV